MSDVSCFYLHPWSSLTLLHLDKKLWTEEFAFQIFSMANVIRMCRGEKRLHATFQVASVKSRKGSHQFMAQWGRCTTTFSTVMIAINHCKRKHHWVIISPQQSSYVWYCNKHIIVCHSWLLTAFLATEPPGEALERPCRPFWSKVSRKIA